MRARSVAHVLAVVAATAWTAAGQAQKKPTGPGGASAKPQLNGVWTGTTSQDKEISIVVRGEEVISLRLSYAMPTSQCPTTREGKVDVVYREPLPGKLEVNYARKGLPQRVLNQRFVLENLPAPRRGAAKEPVFEVRGSFEPGGLLIGEIELTVVEMLGEKEPKTPCKRTTRASFQTKRQQ